MNGEEAIGESNQGKEQERRTQRPAPQVSSFTENRKLKTENRYYCKACFWVFIFFRRKSKPLVRITWVNWRW